MGFHSRAVDVGVAAEGPEGEGTVVEGRSTHVEVLDDGGEVSGPEQDGRSLVVAS
jgi:hypothetical protein